MPTLFRLFCLVIIVALVSGCAAPAATPPPAPSATTIPAATATEPPAPTANLDDQIAANLDTALADLAGKGGLSGVVLVARDGNVIFEQAYGLANNELKIPNSPAIKFHIGSLTKQFTAMAVLQLQQQGKLNVQDPACSYVDECPQAWQPITIHQLLTYTSGLPEFNNIPGILEFARQPRTPLELIAQFRDQPLDFVPGEKYSFSNSGYMLLGTIIEKASGQTYAEFLQKNIFDPLQMNDTGVENAQSTGADYAIGYDADAKPITFIDKSIGYAASGMYSTVEDLLKWDQSLYTDQLLPAALREELFKPFVAVPSSKLSCGYGWFIGSQFGHPWMYMSGASMGFVNVHNRFPDSKVTIIILTNHQDTNLKGLNTLIAPIVFGEEWVSPTS